MKLSEEQLREAIRVKLSAMLLETYTAEEIAKAKERDTYQPAMYGDPERIRDYEAWIKNPAAAEKAAKEKTTPSFAGSGGGSGSKKSAQAACRQTAKNKGTSAKHCQELGETRNISDRQLRMMIRKVITEDKKMKPVDFGVDTWGSFGKWLSTTKADPRQVAGVGSQMSMREALNTLAKKDDAVAKYLALTKPSGRIMWIFEQIPELPQDWTFAGAAKLTTRKGHFDIEFGCQNTPWIPPIYISDIVSGAMEGLDAFDSARKSIYRKLNDVWEEIKDDIPDINIEPIEKAIASKDLDDIIAAAKSAKERSTGDEEAGEGYFASALDSLSLPDIPGAGSVEKLIKAKYGGYAKLADTASDEGSDFTQDFAEKTGIQIWGSDKTLKMVANRAFREVKRAVRQIMQEELGGGIVDEIKHWRYIVTRVLERDPMIAYALHHGADAFEELVSVKIPLSDENVQHFVQRAVMNAFPHEATEPIYGFCQKLRAYMINPLGVPFPDGELLQDKIPGFKDMKEEQQEMVTTLVKKATNSVLKA